MEVYRITQAQYAEDLSGNGARLFGGRWNSEGLFALYTSQSRSLALLENIVHMPVSVLKEREYLVVTLYIPDNENMELISMEALPKNWDAFDADPITRTMGNHFLKSLGKLVLQVPSVLMPEEYNYILNPLMPDMKSVKIIHTRKLVFNDRLLQDF
jgi:RES domain-containing protein